MQNNTYQIFFVTESRARSSLSKETRVGVQVCVCLPVFLHFYKGSPNVLGSTYMKINEPLQ